MSLKHRTNTSNILAAVVLIRELGQEDKQVYRRQQDDLPAHVTKHAYFEYQRPSDPGNGYYVNISTKNHVPIKFIQANESYFWVQLCWRDNIWKTNKGGIIRSSPNLGWWNIEDPQHPDHISDKHFSPTLHTAIKKPEEEILAGGVHHIATLQGSHLFTEQEPILPQIKAAIHQGISIPLNTIPAGTIQPQLSIQTTMAEQIDTTITGPEGQGQPNINVINHNTNGTLKGNPLPIFNGDRSKSRTFLTAFYLWRLTNKHNDTMRKPYSCITALLSYMSGPQVDS